MVDIVSSASCKGCGGPLSLKPGEVIITCEYCGTAFNQATDKAFVLDHSIIPNGLDEEGVKDLLRAWMRGGTKPPTLAKEARFESIRLTFLPFFIVNLKARTAYRGGMTRTGGWVPREGTMEKEYFWKVLARRASAFPTREYDIPISTKVAFDLSRVPSGSTFHNSEMDQDEAVSMARQDIEAHHRFLLQQDIDSVDQADTSFDVDEIEFLHAPVWEVRYVFRGRPYDVLVDGGSRQVIRGDVPPPDTSMKGFFGTIKGALFGD
ncbi:MAG: hypothetical protein L0Z54_05480 [Thermoplasmata archaeon]|nr:hypothetical protein [Thermoplasmata archaeon]